MEICTWPFFHQPYISHANDLLGRIHNEPKSNYIKSNWIESNRIESQKLFHSDLLTDEQTENIQQQQHNFQPVLMDLSKWQQSKNGIKSKLIIIIIIGCQPYIKNAKW